MSATKQRIEYIDLAKGLCILLVVMRHCYLGINNLSFISYLRMPFYFAISGMFFKDYGGTLNLFVKKLNKLVIPFLFFYVLTWTAHYICEYIQPGFWTHQGSFWGDLWSGNYINGPIWFLPVLFWCNIYFSYIIKYVKENLVVGVIVIMAIIGYLTMKWQIFCPFYLLQPFVAMPFFYIGYKLRTSKIVLSKNAWYQPIIAISLFGAVLILDLFSREYVSFWEYQLSGNLILYYLKALMLIVAALLLCKYVKYMPIVSYCGRYSIYILGIHVIFLNVAFHIPNWIDKTGGVIVLIINVLCLFLLLSLV